MIAGPGRRRISAAAAVIGWSAATFGGLGAVVLRLVDPVPWIENDYGFDTAVMVSIVVLGITWATVGALLMVKRRDNAVGRWVLLVGVGHAISMLAGATASYTFAEWPDALLLTRLIAWLCGLTTLLGGLVFYLAMIFPTGRGHTPRWERAAKVLFTATGATVLLLVMMPGPHLLFPGLENPLGFGPDLHALFGERAGSMLLLLAASVCTPIVVASLVSRYRAARQIERTQLRWFISTIVLTTATLVVVGVASTTGGTSVSRASLMAFGLGGSTVPIAIGIAVLRYRLYEIDRIISRTLSWAVISSIIVAVFVLGVITLQAVLAGLIQGPTLAVAASTLLAFALFQPLRRRVQVAIDRRFDRARYDSDRVIADFGRRLREVVDLAALSDEILRVADATVRPVSTAIWLRNHPQRPNTSAS